MDDPVILEPVLNDEISLFESFLHIALSNFVVRMDVWAGQVSSKIIIDGPGIFREIRMNDYGAIRFHRLFRIKEGRQFPVLHFYQLQGFFAASALSAATTATASPTNRTLS